jgi:outer membrane protein
MDERQISKNRKGLFLAGMACLMSIAAMSAQAEEFPRSLQGDIGMGVYYTHSIIRGKGDDVSILPYADFEYGRMFVRVDTLGIKTLKMGYGYLELVGRISQDGFSTNSSSLQGITSRETSVPLGIGTLQVTPLGALMVNLFHDARKSRGDWFEAIYGGEIDLQRVTLYPLIGADYQSREYVRYYYGISPQEAAASQYAAYTPAGSLNALLGLIGDVELSDSYHLNLYVRRKWLGNSIRLSPIVSRGYLDTGYLSLSYRFK